MLLNIALNVILIPSYGIKGAAIATLFSQIVAAYIFDIFSDKTRLTFIMKTKAIFLQTLLTRNSNG
jgi:O-antigen/teichoic acid export membrane protein